MAICRTVFFSWREPDGAEIRILAAVSAEIVKCPPLFPAPKRAEGKNMDCGLPPAEEADSLFYLSCSEAAMAISRAASISLVFSAGFFLAEIL